MEEVTATSLPVAVSLAVLRYRKPLRELALHSDDEVAATLPRFSRLRSGEASCPVRQSRRVTRWHIATSSESRICGHESHGHLGLQVAV
jgi:hypothetical protein